MEASNVEQLKKKKRHKSEEVTYDGGEIKVYHANTR